MECSNFADLKKTITLKKEKKTV